MSPTKFKYKEIVEVISQGVYKDGFYDGCQGVITSVGVVVEYSGRKYYIYDVTIEDHKTLMSIPEDLLAVGLTSGRGKCKC